MKPVELFRHLENVKPEQRIAFLISGVKDWPAGNWGSLLTLAVDTLEASALSDTAVAIRHRDVTADMLGQLPEEFRNPSDVEITELTDQLRRLAMVDGFEPGFVVLRKLTRLSGMDPTPALRLTCEVIAARHQEPDDATVALLSDDLLGGLWHDVDSVLGAIERLKAAHSGFRHVGDFLERVESKLRIVGLKAVLGRSIREKYFKQLCFTNYLERSDGIFLVGPTGTSKTYMAKLIARNSNHRTVVVVNCGRSASQVVRDMERAFDRSETEPISLVLDEVYATKKRAQTYFLSEQTTRSGLKVRVLATSSKTAEEFHSLVEDDFFERIARGWLFSLRPVAEDPRDLEEVLVGYAAYQKKQFEEPVLEALMKHKWPGNHREIGSVITNLAVVCDAHSIARIDLDFLRTHKDEFPDNVRSLLGTLCE